MNVGDIVYLKSGSPPMTVHAVSETITTVWFTMGQRLSAEFPAASLTQTDPFVKIEATRTVALEKEVEKQRAETVKVDAETRI